LNWFRLRNLESGLDRELQYHIDRHVSDLVQSGLPEVEARRQAAQEIGGVTQVQEEVRDIWLTRWLRDFAYDLRFSARSFRRSPSFTATAVLSLANIPAQRVQVDEIWSFASSPETQRTRSLSM